MTDQGGYLTQRIGDRERDQAAEYLRDHLAEGRLDQDEFDERVTAALTAKTQADLDPLFRDLPSPRPSDRVAPLQGFGSQPLVPRELVRRPPYPAMAQSQAKTALAVASAMLWPALIVLMIASGGRLFWLMFLPFFLPWIFGRNNHRGPHRR